MSDGKWWDVSWNPITGCSKISPGCANCYAERISKLFRGPDGFKVTIHQDRFKQPYHWKKSRRVFVCDMGDLFHVDVPFAEINRVFKTISACPQHEFLILTKRAERMAEYFERFPVACGDVWIGVTAENQEMADKRIPILLSIPGFRKFVSVEPMLVPVELEKNWCGYLTGWTTDADDDGRGNPIPVQVQTDKLDWVVLGGETGPGARPMNPDWARSVRDQCVAAGVPFWLKSLDKNHNRILDDREWNEEAKRG
jgi:protein gp37